MAISRTLALACALPLLALLVTSHFVNVSADVSLVGFSSSDVVSYADACRPVSPRVAVPQVRKVPQDARGPATGVTPPPKKVSAADAGVKADLAAAAKLVDQANAVSTVTTYKKSLTDTAQALRNAGILIDQGQRTLVPGQITNAISTIKGVSVMLKPATDKATLGLLKSAQTKAESAQAAFKP
ncbi:unnamed protein product [Closterium sp. Naga37s-1]|nr:unnamed protein product [Closterium sp. Naga37s-1]